MNQLEPTMLLKALLQKDRLYLNEMTQLFEVGWRGARYEYGIISETINGDKFYLTCHGYISFLKEITGRFGKPNTKKALQMILDELKVKDF